MKPTTFQYTQNILTQKMYTIRIDVKEKNKFLDQKSNHNNALETHLYRCELNLLCKGTIEEHHPCFVCERQN